MSTKPGPKRNPAPKRSLLFAFLAAGIGIILLNEAADSLRLHPANLAVVIQIIVGLAGLVLAAGWGARRT